ncbi:hypothetical protein NL676_007092 [Syzygium grande]|nr:hypothetical protein NL676_007092 [Syzygium grande]
MRPTQLFLFVILFAVALKSTRALHPFEFEVVDRTQGTPDTRFSKEVGVDYAVCTARAASAARTAAQPRPRPPAHPVLHQDQGFVFARHTSTAHFENARPPANSRPRATHILKFHHQWPGRRWARHRHHALDPRKPTAIHAIHGVFEHLPCVFKDQHQPLTSPPSIESMIKFAHSSAGTALTRPLKKRSSIFVACAYVHCVASSRSARGALAAQTHVTTTPSSTSPTIIR